MFFMHGIYMETNNWIVNGGALQGNYGNGFRRSCVKKIKARLRPIYCHINPSIVLIEDGFLFFC